MSDTITPRPWAAVHYSGSSDEYWFADGYWEIEIGESDDLTVVLGAHDEGDLTDEAKAIAHLIAAAPTLLEACEAAVRRIDVHWRTYSYTPLSVDHLVEQNARREAIETLRAAIAVAKGQE